MCPGEDLVDAMVWIQDIIKPWMRVSLKQGNPYEPSLVFCQIVDVLNGAQGLRRQHTSIAKPLYLYP